jgi:hypothetical protein
MSRPVTGKLADPAWRAERARNAAVARTTTEAHIKAIVDRAPKLTPAQYEALALALAQHPGAGDGHGA